MAGTITKLHTQKNSNSRVNVYLNGEFAFGLALIHALWLKIGQDLDDDDITRLKSADSLEMAMQRAVGFVAYRPRSVLEVKRRLKKAGADDEQIEAIVVRLKEAELLDDATFSSEWVESRLRSRPRSKRMMAWELKAKGIDGAAASVALAQVDDDKTALELARKRWPRLLASDLTPQERKRKLSDYLARNGYGYEVIQTVIREVSKTWIPST